MARIEVESGDRFVAGGYLYQLRGYEYRCIEWSNVNQWNCASVTWQTYAVPRPNAIAAMRLMGHEVVEVTPEPAPVRITHGVESECGLIAYLGTKEACEKYSKAYGGYRVVPVTF